MRHKLYLAVREVFTNNNATAQRILFSVLSDEIKQITEWRWDRTIRCKIIGLD